MQACHTWPVSPHTLTVAGQRRTLTGFAFMPWFPTQRAPLLCWLFSLEATMKQVEHSTAFACCQVGAKTVSPLG